MILLTGEVSFVSLEGMTQRLFVAEKKAFCILQFPQHFIRVQDVQFASYFLDPEYKKSSHADGYHAPARIQKSLP